jgi:hypothetical protein
VLRSLYDFLFAFLAISAAIATLILFKRDYFGGVSDQGKIAVIFVGFFATAFFLYSLLLTVRWGRTVRYGLVLPYLNQGFSHVHSATRGANPTSREILEACKKLCDTMATAFCVLTSSPCSVSIKIFAKPATAQQEVRIRAMTMCRDSQSSGMRDYPSTTPHWLDENTDFRSIVENISKPRGRFFFSNRLPFYYGYRNTSFSICGGEPTTPNIPGLREFFRYWRWPLPYKSTIVSPICPGISSQRVPNNLVGFLCVDSPRIGAFRERFDTEILIGVADGIFTAVAKYVDLVEGESQ